MENKKIGSSIIYKGDNIVITRIFWESRLFLLDCPEWTEVKELYEALDLRERLFYEGRKIGGRMNDCIECHAFIEETYFEKEDLFL